MGKFDLPDNDIFPVTNQKTVFQVWKVFNSLPIKKFLQGNHIMAAGIEEKGKVITKVRYDKESDSVVWEYLM